MKRIALTICAALVAAPAFAWTAVDGDTMKQEGENVRIIGLDTPETFFARCRAEKMAGEAAKRRLQELLDGGILVVERQKARDKYRRTLAKVTVGGRDVADVMIEEGHAMAYGCPNNRCPRRIDWCASTKTLRQF